MELTRRAITVDIRTLGGRTKAYGLIYGLTAREAHLATSVPLDAGDTLRFRLLHHDPPRTAERYAKVVWTDGIVNLREHLVAECRVEWLSESEASAVDLFRHEIERQSMAGDRQEV